MSTESPSPVTINILDKEYRVSCAPGERDALVNSASFLNGKMKEVRDTGKVIGMDRISIMAALNITHDLLKYKGQVDNFELHTAPRLRALQLKIDTMLDKGRQLELG